MVREICVRHEYFTLDSVFNITPDGNTVKIKWNNQDSTFLSHTHTHTLTKRSCTKCSYSVWVCRLHIHTFTSLRRNSRWLYETFCTYQWKMIYSPWVAYQSTEVMLKSQCKPISAWHHSIRLWFSFFDKGDIYHKTFCSFQSKQYVTRTEKLI